jgi:hypothetical protein
MPVGGENLTELVRRTGRPARIDDYATATGAIGAHMNGLGVSSAVGCPIVVDGRRWGIILASPGVAEPLPAETEARIAKFTELVATAISNVQTRSDLAESSRARIVAAADDERRRVVRDLHDGAQQRLVKTIVTLKLAREALQQAQESATGLVGEALDQSRPRSRELAPRTEMRRWFDRAPERFGEFRARYREELAGQADKLNEQRARAAEGTVTILHGARDRKHNNPTVLAELPSDR